MQVTVEIPDQFAHDLVPEGCDPARLLLEEAVASGYRDGRLKSTEQVRVLLGFGYFTETEAFLLKHEIYDYTIEDLESDMATLAKFRPHAKVLQQP